MSTPAAKDLLAQADRMMRQRVPEELPVLTDLIVEEIHIGDAGVLHPPARPPLASPPASPHPSAPASPHPPAPAAPRPSAPAAAPAVPAVPRASAAPAAPPAREARPAAPHTTTGATAREQFNALLLSRLDELRHSIYSQVMQQLELHAAGSLKTHLRESLTVALADIARDIAEQVAEDTSAQVRDVVSRSVDAEIARLREQLSRRRT